MPPLLRCFQLSGAYTGTGLVVEDSEVSCGDGPGTAFGDSNITARRVEVHGCENGFDVDVKVTIEDSYIHDLWAGGDAHTDGIQIAIGDDVTIRHNRIEAGTNGTSAIISPSSGTNNVTVDRNLMSGGAATLYCRQKAPVTTTGLPTTGSAASSTPQAAPTCPGPNVKTRQSSPATFGTTPGSRSDDLAWGCRRPVDRRNYEAVSPKHCRPSFDLKLVAAARRRMFAADSPPEELCTVAYGKSLPP